MKYCFLILIILSACASREYANEPDWSKVPYVSYNPFGLKPVVKAKRGKAKSEIRAACKPKSFRIIREEIERDKNDKKLMRLYYRCE